MFWRIVIVQGNESLPFAMRGKGEMWNGEGEVKGRSKCFDSITCLMEIIHFLQKIQS